MQTGESGMLTSLFRPEVRFAQQNEWLGAIRLQAPRLGWIFFSVGFLAITTILSLLLCGHYTRHEQVNGSLVPSSGLLTTAPTTSGIVTRVLVREGDLVRAGQALLEISGVQDSVSVGDTQAAIAHQLQVKRNRLQSDLDEQQHLAKLQEKDFRSRLAMLQGQIALLDQQIELQSQRATSSMQLYEQWSKAGETGVVSKLDVLQQHDTALQNLAAVKELEGQASQLRQQAVQMQSQLDQLPTTTANKLNDTERQLADVMQSVAQNAAQSAVILRASANGTVTNVLVHSGETVIAQQPLITELPTNATLRAELWVPSQAIGFIHTGETVVMRYHAFPYQKFGQHIGRVQEVSRSAVSASEVSRLLGQSISDPRYRVEVSLDSQSVLAYGKSEVLRPGMALDADVMLDRRKLIEWVLDPLYSHADANEQVRVNGNG